MMHIKIYLPASAYHYYNNYDGLKSKFCTFYILLPVLSNVCSILNLKNNNSILLY